MVRILSIILISSMFSGLCAGTLPADFKFKSPDGSKRTSFMEQFKEYQETKEKGANTELRQALLKHDPSMPIEAHDTIGCDKEAQFNFIERCKQLIARMVASFSASK